MSIKGKVNFRPYEGNGRKSHLDGCGYYTCSPQFLKGGPEHEHSWIPYCERVIKMWFKMV